MRQHLVTRIRQLLDADMAFYCDALVCGKPLDNEGWAKPISLIDEWQHEEARHFFWRFLRRGRAEGTPIETIMTEALASKSSIRVAARRDLIDDEAWHTNPLFEQEPAKVRMDDFVMGMIARDTLNAVEEEGRLIQILFLQREQNREPFSRRTVRAIKVLLIELAKLQPQELKDVNDSAFMTLPLADTTR